MGLTSYADITGKILFNTISTLLMVVMVTAAGFVSLNQFSAELQNLFQNVEKIFLYLLCTFLFTMSTIAFCFFISNFIRNMNTCKDVTGILIFGLIVVPLIGIGNSSPIISTALLVIPHFAYISCEEAYFQQSFLKQKWQRHLGIAFLFVEIFLYTFLYLFVNGKTFFKIFYKSKVRNEVRLPAGIEEDLISQSGFDNEYGIKIQGIKKKFGSFNALDGIDLELGTNKVTCILGHNGAGKTTLVNTICGVLNPTEGRILVQGKDAHKTDFLRGRVGYCSGRDCLYEPMTVKEYLSFISRLKMLANSKEDIQRVVDFCDLNEFFNQRIKNLSGGTKRRTSLAAALLGSPSVVLLDEPSSGVDPENRRKIWQAVEKSKSEQRVIILTTHHLEEAEYLSEDVIIMSKGKVEVRGDPNLIMSKFGVGYTLPMRLENQSQLETLQKELHSFSSHLNLESLNFQVTGKVKLKIPIAEKKLAAKVTRLLNNMNISYGLESNSLEEAFIQLGEKELKDENFEKGQNWREAAMDEIFKKQYKPSVWSIFAGLAYRRYLLITSSFYQIVVFVFLIILPGFSVLAFVRSQIPDKDIKANFVVIFAIIPVIVFSYNFVCSFYAYIPAYERDTRMRYFFLLKK